MTTMTDYFYEMDFLGTRTGNGTYIYGPQVKNGGEICCRECSLKQ